MRALKQWLCLVCFVCAALDANAHDASAEHKQYAALVAFSGLKTGDKVAHFLPGSDDFDAVFCAVVGAAGHVYTISAPIVNPSADAIAQSKVAACGNLSTILLKSRNFPAPELYDSVGDPGAVYEYYQPRLPVESFIAPEPLDMIVIADRYHDLHNKTFGAPNLTFVNSALFKALKAGGILIVQDYAAQPAVGRRDAATLQRIAADSVKQEVTSAGFEFVSESKAPNDSSGLSVARDQTPNKADRFLLKFRKP